MGARIFVVVGGAALVGAAFVMQACGETEPAAEPVNDAGLDVEDSAPSEDAPPVDEDAATCDLSADFTEQIPDASIADGASTSGLCLECAKAKCGAQIAACNQDCPCQGVVGEALECYLKNTSNPFVCAGSLATVDDNTRNLGIALITCINSGCRDECATSSFQDAGSDAGSDAGPDAD
ncbi:MAG: hypothetical protein KIS78_25685 [Labilithrix sp.]|nr:hypothetical protein [Labilithrix sp.]MCW5835817.1 hypothetical protein [Labilithrix sp.]